MPAQAAPYDQQPVLLELFTSEGCSSCPPVDDFLQRMDSTQPVHGANLIVLSEHVDYWDHEGWKDPYSSHLLTGRQAAYVRSLHLSSAYTPQVVVDGTTVLRGDGKQIEALLVSSAASPKVPVSIDSGAALEGSTLTLHVRIDVPAIPLQHSAEVFIALALDHAESQVSAGENGGKRLTHVAVVRELKKIGKLENGKAFDRDVALKLAEGTDRKNLRFIAFVQEAGQGHVLGAAMRRFE